MEQTYEVKYNGQLYTIIIYNSDNNKYSCDIQYPGGCYESYIETEYETILELLFNSVSLICVGDISAIKKIMREIKIDEIFH